MTMPVAKNIFPNSSIEELWVSRWKYSNPLQGKMIERALQATGQLVIDKGVIYQVNVTMENLDGTPKVMTVTSVNVGRPVTGPRTDPDYVSQKVTSLTELFPYINMREQAFKTIQSIMRKMRTPIILSSQRSLKLTPCEGSEILDCDIASIEGDLMFKNVDFQVSGQISDVIQMYHDAESILLKMMGIPATFLSRSSGMGASEVDDASAIDDLIRARELKVREDICNFLGITVEWNIPLNKDKPTEVIDNGNRDSNTEFENIA